MILEIICSIVVIILDLLGFFIIKKILLFFNIIVGDMEFKGRLLVLIVFVLFFIKL